MSNLTRRRFLELSACGALGAALPSFGCKNRRNADRPNVIVILADDMGFSDAGCYGGDIHTPNIDRLASNGLKFTQFHNAARCCPTRASLLTGQYQHKVNMATNGNTLGRNGITIAEGMKQAGYNTAMVGKWHLSKTKPLPDKQKQLDWLNHQYDPGIPFAPLDSYPVNRGFDSHYGIIWGVADYFDPFSLVDGTEPVEDVPDDFYLTDALTKRSVENVHDFAKQDNPFFMYLAYTASHWPLHAREEDIAKYEKMFDDGWDAMRKRRFKRQVELGLFDKDKTNLPPVQDGGADWDGMSEEEKEFMADKMAAHAAMVDRMDQGIGKLLDALEETGQLDNTLILFLSDNGASPELPKNWGPGFDRPSETREGEKIRYEGFKEAGSETTFTGIGPAWASASNTPYRYWKAEQYEGGSHTPFIAHWPAGLKVEPGSTTHQPGHIMDILPTCLELAGAEYPEKYQGHKITPMDGLSLTPILEGEQRKGHDRLFFEHVGGKALIEDDWKIVSLRKPNDHWRLYNLAEDPTETNNLADKYPDKLNTMVQEWTKWGKTMGLHGKQLEL